MLTIYSPDGRMFRVIPHSDFFNNLSAGELLEDHPEYNEQSHWSFEVFPDKLRIYSGNPQKPLELSLASHVNVGCLKKCWYLCYCEHAGYTYDYYGDSR